MSKKFVLIPLRTFTDLCSQTKKSGDTITGILKSHQDPPNGSKKRTQPIPKKRLLLFVTYNILHYLY